MIVADIMSTEVTTVDHNQRADVALGMMEDQRIRHLVVTENGRATSIVSNRDLLVGAYMNMTSINNPLQPNQVSVGNLATRNPITLSPGTSVLEAAKLVLDKKISAFPVLEGSELKGILTTHDLMRVLVEKLS